MIDTNHWQRTTDDGRFLLFITSAPFVFYFALGGVGAFFRLGAIEGVAGRREGLLADRVGQRAFAALLRRLLGVR